MKSIRLLPEIPIDQSLMDSIRALYACFLSENVKIDTGLGANGEG